MGSAKRDINFAGFKGYNLKRLDLNDQDATPVGDIVLINKDQTLLVRDPTDATYKTIHLSSVPDLSSLYSVLAHTHGQLHDRSHLITSTSDHSPTGLTASQLIRLNAGATALESSGKTISDFEASGAVSTHAALTATHGVGGTIAGKADIAVDANLSVAAQAAIAASHARSHTLVSTSDHSPAGLTASQLLRLNAGATAVESSGKVITDFAAASHIHPTSGASAINRLAEVTPTAAVWGVNPSDLPNCVDRNWATVTGYGDKDVADSVEIGELVFDMGAAYTVHLIAKIGTHLAAAQTGNIRIATLFSTDGATYYYQLGYYGDPAGGGGAVIEYLNGVTEHIGFLNASGYGRYIKMSLWANSAKHFYARFYEAVALDWGVVA